jgi:BCD family chlorophyll transporter-like MFS transporter
MRVGKAMQRGWQQLGTAWMPFADVATAELPLSRLLRLSLFQISVGMATTLFVGTLNRVMIVEMGIAATVVAVMVAIPLLVAPFRALIGFRSDTYKCVLGWRRVPFIWFGTMMQFGGLAIMPFALIVLSPAEMSAPHWAGYVGSALAFLLVGLGAATTQTAGLALATDLVPEDRRPRVVALMYLMMLVGTVLAAFTLGIALRDYSPVLLIKVIQGAGLLTLVLNTIALWKQEVRVRGVVPYAAAERRPLFREAWRTFSAGGDAIRLLVATGLGFFAFNLQDVLLEPYGGEILGLSVGATTALTGIAALGAIAAFALAAHALERGGDPIRLAALGCGTGIVSFAVIIFAAPLDSGNVFRVGTAGIGFGEGLFAVATLTAAMGLKDRAQHGIALGAWGAVYATSEGLAFAVSGVIKDVVSYVVSTGRLGDGLALSSVPYSVVYHLEILVLFATFVALGPLVSRSRRVVRQERGAFGLADLPA